MKFLKKHKWLSFAVISFFMLSGVNFYMIFELVRVIRENIGTQAMQEIKKCFTLNLYCGILRSSKNVSHYE
ncbi:MAG: hypothetical protein IJE68_00485 [Clostridia bacterium]|nr:hypothetical protein [Clostridia bacterium]